MLNFSGILKKRSEVLLLYRYILFFCSLSSKKMEYWKRKFSPFWGKKSELCFVLGKNILQKYWTLFFYFSFTSDPNLLALISKPQTRKSLRKGEESAPTTQKDLVFFLHLSSELIHCFSSNFQENLQQNLRLYSFHSNFFFLL